MTFAKRTAFGVIVGIVTWWIAFWASLAIFVSAWPALYEATRPALARGDVSRFTTPMWLLFLSMYLWVNPVAGWVTAVERLPGLVQRPRTAVDSAAYVRRRTVG